VQRICVYCGSSPGERPVYAEAARALAGELASRGVDAVYGGSCKGIMGVLADALLAAGGKVYGVMPHSLVRKEVGHAGLTELHMTETMHERKGLMADMADGFIAMPGGFGTLEEIIEILTWGQLGFHDKPCGLLNVDGYFDRLLAYLRHAEQEGFVKSAHLEMLMVESEPAALLDRFTGYVPPAVAKWRD